MDKGTLMKAGLTKSEIKVYLALLGLKSATRGKIVEKSEITGSKVYDVLKRLKQKGLVSIYSENNVLHFKALNPKQIISFLDDKKHEIDIAKEKVNAMIPSLMSLFNTEEEDHEVELLSGLKGLHMLFKEQVEILDKNDFCYVIGGTKGSDESVVHAFFEKVHKWREEKGIRSKMLFNEKQRKTTLKHYSKKSYSLTQTKFISHTSPVAINVYANKTIIIIFGKQISAIKITSNDVANSFLEYFKLLWGNARK